MSLHALEFLGYQANKSIGRPVLIEKSSDEKGADLFTMEFESFPLDSKADYRLHLHTQPLQIIYDAVRLVLSSTFVFACLPCSRKQSINWCNAFYLIVIMIYRGLRITEWRNELLHRLISVWKRQPIRSIKISKNARLFFSVRIWRKSKISICKFNFNRSSSFFLTMEHSQSTNEPLSSQCFPLNWSSASSVLCLNLGQFTFTDLIHHRSEEEPALEEPEKEEEGEEIFEDASVSSFSRFAMMIDGDISLSEHLCGPSTVLSSPSSIDRVSTAVLHS